MPQPDLAELLERGAARPQTPGDIDEVWRRGQSRRRRKRAGIVAGTVLAVVAFVTLVSTLWLRPSAPFIQQAPDASERWGPLAVVPGSAGGDEALINGTLKITDRCVALVEQDDDVLLVWPADATTWNPDEGTITYTNRDGDSVQLRDGMQVSFGGGGDSTTEGGEPPQVWAQQIDWTSRPASECLTDTRWWVNAVATNVAEWPESCPVTVPGHRAFTPQSEAPEGPPPLYEAVWYGAPELWTMISPKGEEGDKRWLGGEKTFWWSKDFSVTEEPNPNVVVTAERLDGTATIKAGGPGTNGSHPDLGDFMLVGVELPQPGCWEITARYKGATLSYVVWVDSE